MKEDENVATYFVKVDEIVKSIRGFGESIKGSIVIRKVLISLPNRYDPTVSDL